MKNVLNTVQTRANLLLDVKRLAEHEKAHYEIKDPSVVAMPDGTFMMFASVGNSVTQTWKVGRFVAVSPQGPWQEIAPVDFQNISGPQLCAPAVTYEEVNNEPLWKMYIQTACFEENGVIVLATSKDGLHFVGESQTLASRTTLVEEHQSSVIGVYDVGVSEVKTEQEDLLCMMFSGYRRVGCGDLYVSYRNKNSTEQDWGPAQKLLSQEDVPFHNHPDYENFEWGLEGAKLVQMSENSFLLIGVCFLPKPKEFLGTRQRVFFAMSNSLNGPFIPLCTPFEPSFDQGKAGENGHPDTIILGDDLWVIYQERAGEGKPWHLRSATFDLNHLETQLKEELNQGATIEAELITETPSLPIVSQTEQVMLLS